MVAMDKYYTSNKANGAAAAYVVMAAFMAIWLLLGLVVHTLTAIPPEPDHTDRGYFPPST